MVVVVRRAVEADWEQSRAVRLRALREAPLAFASTYEREVELGPQQWRKRIRGSAQFVAVSEAGMVVGTATGVVDPEDPATVLLVGMFVIGEARRRGVGGQLVTAVVGEARRLGARRVRLRVVETNLGAERLYRRCGFVPTGDSMPLPHSPDLLEHELALSL